MEDPDYGTSSHLIKGLDETFKPFKNSGSDYVPDLTHMEQDHEQSQSRQSTHE